MTYVFDLDGTLCNTVGTDYDNAEPIQKRIDQVNKLHYDGHIIIINTGRYVSMVSGKCINVNRGFNRVVEQLDKWGVKYTDVRVGNKIIADIYVDDKAVNARDFFGRELD